MNTVNCIKCGDTDCHNTGIDATVFCSNFVRAKGKVKKKTTYSADKRASFANSPKIKRAVKEHINNKITEEKW